MSIQLNSNSAAFEQLAAINAMAQSSTGKIAGNMGLVGGRIIKFNTHFSERLFGSTTEAMRAASDDLRVVLKDLIGKVMLGDRAKTEELCRMIDGKGDRSLLDRKVVAKVIEKAQAYTGQSMMPDADAIAAHSSRSRATDFASANLAAARDTVRAQFEAKMQVLMASLGPEATAGRVGEVFRAKVDLFLKTFIEANIKTSEPLPARFDRFMLESMGLLWRLAKSEVEPGQSSRIPFQLPPQVGPGALDAMAFSLLGSHCNYGLAASFMHLAAGHEDLAVKLLALNPDCGGPSRTNVLLADADFVARMEAHPEDLSRAALYRQLAHAEPPAGLDSLKPFNFCTALENAFANRLSGGDPVKELVIANNRSGLEGAQGYIISEDLMLNLINPPAGGLHVTLNDLKFNAHSFDVGIVQRGGANSCSRSLRKDLPRNRPNITVGDERFAFLTTPFARDQGGMMAQMSSQPLEEKIGSVCQSETQKLVVEMLLTQGGMPLTMNFSTGSANGKDPLEISVQQCPNGDVRVSYANVPKNDGAPRLTYALLVHPDGENELVELDYTVPAR